MTDVKGTTTSLKSITENLMDSLSKTRTWLIILAVIVFAYSLYQMWVMWGKDASWMSWIITALVAILGLVGIFVYFSSSDMTQKVSSHGGKVRLSSL